MTHVHARRLPALSATVVTFALTLAACAAGTAIPSPSTTTSPSGLPTATPSATAAATHSAGPITTSTAPATSPASAATACVATPQTIEVPSDRLVNLTVAPGGTSDTVTFAFGNPSLPGPPAPPSGTLALAKPPYTVAESGRTIEMHGDHVITVRFTGMSLQNDAGEETYKGPRGVEEPFPALRHAVVYDESEGVIGFYVGYDGPGCVTLTREGTNVVLSIAHG
jgi:hypothetical protein